MKALVVASIANFITRFEINDIRLLTELGYEVHCATNFDYAREERLCRLIDYKVVFHQVDFNRNPLAPGNIKAYNQLRNLLKIEEFDLIHCHTPIGGVLTRLAAKRYRKSGTKVMYTAHGFHFFEGAPKKNWLIYYPIEKWLSKYTDVLITINTEDYKRALNKFHAMRVVYIPGVGLDTKKFELCHVDIETKREELGIKNRDFVILSVGELQDRKNQGIVIEAFNLIKNDGKLDDYKYLIVGEGHNRDKYIDLIKDFQLENNVILLGYRTDIEELCKVSDCFIHPSIREGLGIAPLEAMASGLPLLCSNVNGIKDYAKNEITGIVFDPYSCEEIKNAIIRIREDSKLRDNASANNILISHRFDIRETEKIMRKIYLEVYTSSSHTSKNGL